MDAPTITMPCPRLEFRWEKTGDDWTSRTVTYALVIPLQEHDIRREDEDGNKVRSELALEIGKTNCSGGNGHPPIHEGEVDTPYRDHAHAVWDREAMGGHLPIVAICGDVATIVKIKPRNS